MTVLKKFFRFVRSLSSRASQRNLPESEHNSMYVHKQKARQLIPLSPGLLLLVLLVVVGEFILRWFNHDPDGVFLRAGVRALLYLPGPALLTLRRRPKVVQRVTVTVCRIWVRTDHRKTDDPNAG